MSYLLYKFLISSRSLRFALEHFQGSPTDSIGTFPWNGNNRLFLIDMGSSEEEKAQQRWRQPNELENSLMLHNISFLIDSLIHFILTMFKVEVCWT